MEIARCISKSSRRNSTPLNATVVNVGSIDYVVLVSGINSTTVLGIPDMASWTTCVTAASVPVPCNERSVYNAFYGVLDAVVMKQSSIQLITCHCVMKRTLARLKGKFRRLKQILNGV